MEISGSQKVKAPRQQVFQALLDPQVLKNSVPGCESAEFEDSPSGRQIKLVISTNMPGLKGPFNIFLQNSEVVPPSHLVLTAEPYNASGTVKATCAIDLAEDPEGTLLTYKASAEASGKIANIPDMVVNGAVKMGMGQFFKNFEKQVSAARV